MKKKSKLFGAVLGLIFGVLSGFYVSFVGTILSIVLWFASIAVTHFVFRLYTPTWWLYVSMLFFAIFNYRYIGIRNEAVEELNYETEYMSAKEYKYSVKMVKNYVGIGYGVTAYNWLFSLYVIFSIGEDIFWLFSEGSIFRGIVSILLIPFILWAVFTLAGLIQSLLIGLFGVAKYLTDKDIREPYSRENDPYYSDTSDE